MSYDRRDRLAAADSNNDGKTDLVLGAPGGTGNNSYVESGWFGVIYDPANASTSSDQTCITVGTNLNLTFPYLKYGESTFGIVLNYEGGYFSPDLNTITDADTTSDMIEINSDFSIDVACAYYSGTFYSFTLVLVDALSLKWSIDQNSFTIIQ